MTDTGQTALAIETASTEAMLYDKACRAIAEAARVDEAKNIRDKAMALAIYARQAKNVDMERQAREIRVRAERRCGVLLSEKEKAKGTRGQLNGRDLSGGHLVEPPEPSLETLASLGITKRQSSTWQQLAAVPEPDFEAAVTGERMPSAKAIILATTKPKPQRTTKAGEGAVTREIRERVRPMVESGEPISVQEVVAATGRSRIVIEGAIAYERGRLAGLAEAARRAPVDPVTLSKTARDKLEAAERRMRAQLEEKFERRVREEVRLRLAKRDTEDAETIEQANELMAHSTGRLRPPFTSEQYYQILWALHPDNNDKAKTTDAFIMIRQKKLLLCDEGPIKRRSSLAAPLPKTAAELMERKQAMKQAKRA